MPTSPDRGQRNGVLTLLCLAVFMAYLDSTVVNVALPDIASKLDSDISTLQWIVDAYVLAFASLLLSAGTLGDDLGRKRIFLVGLLGFTVTSALCGLSPNITMLLVFRMLQGAFASILIPLSLALVSVTYTDPLSRAKAIGVWAGIGGVALATGPVVGGVLVEHLGWQSIFWLNVPIGLVAAGALSRLLTENRAPRRRSIDVVGQLLFVVAIAALVYALIEANPRGWGSPVIVGCLVGSAAALVAFLFWEARRPEPMLPLGMFRNRPVVVAAIVNLVSLFGLYSTIFLMTLYLQTVTKLSATQTGVRFLALTAAIMVASLVASRLAATVDSRWLIFGGGVLSSLGLLGLLGLRVDSGFGDYWWAFTLLGVGVSLAGAPATVTMLAAVPRDQSGTASGISNTFRQLGSAFGVAIAGAVLLGHLTGGLPGALRPVPMPEPVRTQAVEVLSHGDLSQVAKLPASARAGAFHAAAPVFVGGIHTAVLIAAIASPFGGLAALVILPRRRRRETPAGAPTTAAGTAATPTG